MKRRGWMLTVFVLIPILAIPAARMKDIDWTPPDPIAGRYQAPFARRDP